MNILYQSNYADGVDRYAVYVWNQEFGWSLCNGYTTGNAGVPFSLEMKYYAYTTDCWTPDDRSYKVELVIYPHKDRKAEAKCNIYNYGTGEVITSKPLNY